MELFGPHLYRERALYENGEWISYSVLRQRIQALAVRFPRERSLAFCFCQIDSATIINYLACLLCGHPVVLLDANLNAEAQRALVELYQPRLILSPQGPQLTEFAPKPLDAGLALLLSTSGSTGSPKLVRLTRRNILSNADSIVRALHIRPEDCAMASLPFHYSYGLSVLHSHLRTGAALALTRDGILSNRFWDTCRSAGCNSMAGVPYTYQVLQRLQLGKLNVPQLTTLTQAGGKLHANLIKEFHQICREREGRFFVMYGQTEATARMAILPPQDLPAKLGSVGLAVPAGSFAIEEGEVVYQGPNVMLGYATCREDLARGDELNGRLRTGDSGHLDQDGYLYINGRLKREAKISGHRVNLDEIEDLLKHHGPTAAVAAAEKVVIYCEWGDAVSHSVSLRELAHRLRFSLQCFEFKHIGALPLSSNGKIDYASLAEKP